MTSGRISRSRGGVLELEEMAGTVYSDVILPHVDMLSYVPMCERERERDVTLQSRQDNLRWRSHTIGARHLLFAAAVWFHHWTPLTRPKRQAPHLEASVQFLIIKVLCRDNLHITRKAIFHHCLIFHKLYERV